MKKIVFYLPAVAIGAGGFLWFTAAASEGRALREQLKSERAASTAVVRAHQEEMLTAELHKAALSRQAAELRAAVTKEQAAMEDAIRRTAAVRAKLPASLEHDTVVSYGRITDMGAELGEAVQSMVAMQKSGKMDEKAQKDLGRTFMKLMTWLPEISRFEEQPGEIASFQASALGQMLDWDEAKTKQAEGIIRNTFTGMKAAGLTAAHSAEANWRDRRSESLGQMLWQLRPFIPPDFESAGVIPQIVNIGAGVETKSDLKVSKEPGKSQGNVSMSLPSWPRLPWLPKAATK
jgi:hypothetical protein